MAISSMTGFARADGQKEGCSWTWEMRGVNGRGLEIRCRLPAGFEGLEPAVRERVARRIKRGNVSMTLALTWIQGRSAVRINADALEEVLALVSRLQQRFPEFRPPSADGLLALRGVIEPADQEPSAEERAVLEAAFLDGFDQALTALAAMRRREGERLAPVLGEHLERVATLCGEAEGLAVAQPAAIQTRLREQVNALLEAMPALPAERLAQETALLAAKADPREELDRLKAHQQAARALLAEANPVGRKLDFLCQEFNREANTLCSKSADVELTRIGVEIKTAIEQFREQVQNIE